MRPVDLVVTELAVIAFGGDRPRLVETAPGVSVAQVIAATEAELDVPASVPSDAPVTGRRAARRAAVGSQAETAGEPRLTMRENSRRYWWSVSPPKRGSSLAENAASIATQSSAVR